MWSDRARLTVASLVVVAGAATAPLLAAAPSVGIVQAPNSPVTLAQVKLLNTEGIPWVLLYSATNVTDAELDQFTVTVYVFDKDKRLQARQVAPGRRTLNPHETKFSAMVLDVGGIEAGTSLLVGVNQAQKAGSDDWWRADLRTLAEAQIKN